MSRILLPGDTGYGILIETDAGYVDKTLNQNLLKENFEFEPDSPITINCILQKWGVKNRNGRIYPKEILIPQIEEYQKMVDTNSGAGECVTPDHKILTSSGWKYIKDVNYNEEILTLNKENNEIEKQKITEKIYQYVISDIYKFKSNNLSINATPNHRFLLEDKNGKKHIYTAKEIYDNKNNVLSNGNHKILKRSNWIGKDDKYFHLGKYKIKINDWMSFMGIYLSEGCVDHSRISNKIQITQRKKETIIKIENLLSKLPFNVKKNVRKTGTVDFHIYDKTLRNYLHPLGKSNEKYIPSELKEYSSDALSCLFDWFMISDSRNVKIKSNKKSIFSASKKLIEDLHEILIKMGGSGNITTYQPKDREIIDDIEHINEYGEVVITKTKRQILSKNSKLQYNLNVSTTNHIWLDKRSIKIKKEKYEGYIVCVQVPNETFLVQHNGISHWTLNSDHPDTSVVSLDNISHLIKKMWWGEGDKQNILYGKLEIITSPAYMRNGIVCMIGDKIIEYLKRGIRLGISSRGVGSLKEVRGENVVQNDFELICFDLVASPSTPGAYLFPQSNEINIGENTSTKKNNLVENNKIVSAIDDFLLL